VDIQAATVDIPVLIAATVALAIPKIIVQVNMTPELLTITAIITGVVVPQMADMVAGARILQVQGKR
jgi:preprotein translocase subunit Sec63